jgi:putative addiction module component (TIGR02574 family)
MTSNAAKLLADALRLPDSERAEIAARLIDSLDLESDHDAKERWDEEVARRLDELDRGAVTPIPWPEARRRILGGTDGATEN